VPSANNSLLQLKIDGWEDLERALRELGSDKDIRLSLKRALNNKATKQMRDYAESLAPKATGRMARKIAVSTTLSRRQRRDRGFGGGREADQRYAVLFIGAGPKGPGVLDEFGTKVRRHKNGKNVGRTPPQPFMRPAWESYKDAILAEFTKELWVQIEKSAKRIARRQAKLLKGKT
jgi:HK97 gp10 family phage protein